MIENYPNKRRMHCETGVLVNMMEYNGYHISEPMAFGIGSGMYFLYFPKLRTSDATGTFPLVVLRTKPTCIIRNYTKRMHIGYHEQTFGKDAFKAERALDELIAKNIPVGVVVNLIGVKYLNDLGFSVDYNGHHMTVIGKEGTQYIIADVDEKLPNDDYQVLEAAAMRSVRFRSGISAPHGRMFYFDQLPADFAEITTLKSAIVSGLKETCKNMLSIPMPWFGCRGIHYYAKEMRKWPRKYSEEEIDKFLYAHYRFIEQAGTGGSGYRYIYSDFLKEAAEVFQSEALLKSSDIMRKAADSWRVFTVNGSRHIKKTGVTSNEMADIIDEAGNLEHETFVSIKDEFLKHVK